MAEVDVNWVRSEINRLGLRWRQEQMAGDLVIASYYDGMMRALGEVLAAAGALGEVEVEALIAAAKGVEE